MKLAWTGATLLALTVIATVWMLNGLVGHRQQTAATAPDSRPAPGSHPYPAQHIVARPRLARTALGAGVAGAHERTRYLCAAAPHSTTGSPTSATSTSA